VLGASVITEHVAPLADEQFVHRLKLEPLLGVAVRVTLDVVKLAVQVPGQLIA